MELENLGFIDAVLSQSNFDVSVINFYNNPVFYKKLTFTPLRLTFFELFSLFFSLRFLKIFLKSGFRLDQSLSNLSINFPEKLERYIERELILCSICFLGIRPGKLPNLVHDLAQRHQKPIIYHEISKFNHKYHSFFEKINAYGTFFISGIEKEENLQFLFPKARKINIKQWIYDGQEKFLRISKPNPETLVFGTLSRLDYGKNFEVVFVAISILKDRGEKFKYLLFGDGPELIKLVRLVDSLKIQSIVEFRGEVKFEERTKVYEEIDVFLMCSLIEGGPVTILEAMASGRSAISTDVGDVRNRIQNDFNGFILRDPTEPLELANLMSQYLNEKELVINHGENSRAKFLIDFNEIKCKNIFLEAISNLIPS